MIDKKFSAGYEDISVTVVDYQRDNEINKLIEKEVK